MSKPFVVGKIKPLLCYYMLSLDDAMKVIDYYVSNCDSEKFAEAGIFSTHRVRMEADDDGGDEYYAGTSTGTYTVVFKSDHCYKAYAPFEDDICKDELNSLENLHTLISSELRIE